MLQILQTIGLIIFCAVVLILAFYLLRNTKIMRKNIKKKSFIIFVLLVGVGMFITSNYVVTEHLLTFQSPESVFRYTRMGTIEQILYGDDSYVVIYTRRDGTDGYFIARKFEGRYKLPDSTRRVAHRQDQMGIFRADHVRNTDDHYIIGAIVSAERELDIRDRYNEEIANIFFEAQHLEMTDMYSIWFIMFAEDFTDDFYLYINGERLHIAG